MRQPLVALLSLGSLSLVFPPGDICLGLGLCLHTAAVTVLSQRLRTRSVGAHGQAVCWPMIGMWLGRSAWSFLITP